MYSQETIDKILEAMNAQYPDNDDFLDDSKFRNRFLSYTGSDLKLDNLESNNQCTEKPIDETYRTKNFPERSVTIIDSQEALSESDTIFPNYGERELEEPGEVQSTSYMEDGYNAKERSPHSLRSVPLFKKGKKTQHLRKKTIKSVTVEDQEEILGKEYDRAEVHQETQEISSRGVTPKVSGKQINALKYQVNKSMHIVIVTTKDNIKNHIFNVFIN